MATSKVTMKVTKKVTACVVDTSAWIEWLVGSTTGKRLAKEIPDKPDCVVPTIVQLELAKWLTREMGEDEADRVIAYTQKCVVVALDTRLALLAAELHRSHKLATADAIVYATARDRGLLLLTCDAHFESLPDVILFAKS
jgi:predicted nucleic acid-binding protein